ncbi:MAG: phosphotransferase [Dehalococcoidia bacterium]
MGAEHDRLDLRAACAAFGLGEPADCQPVPGGLSHRMWQLRTDRGIFAVKQLNRDFANDEWWVAWYERAFRIEMACFEAGVPLPRPIPTAAGRALAEIAGADDHPLTLRANEWVEGVPGMSCPTTPEIASQVGEILATIHGLQLPVESDTRLVLKTFGPAHWTSLRERLARAGWEHAGLLDVCQPAVVEAEQLVEAATARAAAPLMSHRDADQKNVLLQDSRVFLLDWDAAGPVHPRQEVAKEALNWSGAHRGDPRPELVAAMFEGYRRAGGVFDHPSPDDFAEYFCVLLGWLEFNLRRVLGERIDHPGAQIIAGEQAVKLLQTIPGWSGAAERWARSFERVL